MSAAVLVFPLWAVMYGPLVFMPRAVSEVSVLVTSVLVEITSTMWKL